MCTKYVLSKCNLLISVSPLPPADLPSLFPPTFFFWLINDLKVVNCGTRFQVNLTETEHFGNVSYFWFGDLFRSGSKPTPQPRIQHPLSFSVLSFLFLVIVCTVLSGSVQKTMTLTQWAMNGYCFNSGTFHWIYTFNKYILLISLIIWFPSTLGID